MELELILSQHGFKRITSDRTWVEASQRWLTLNTHQRDFKKQKIRLSWLTRQIGNRKLSSLDNDFVFSVAQLKKSQTSSSTANRHMALLRSILRMARDDWGWLHWVPKIPFFKEPDHRVRWLQPSQAAILVQELPPHLSAMAIFTLATGLRQSNVMRLRWSSVDLKRRLAWVSSSESKGSKSFHVPLNSTAIHVLNSQPVINDWVFNYDGHPVTKCSTAAWYKALSRAGITDFRWHDLRHTWASWHVQSGTSIYELKELGGWKTLDMVLRYAHLGVDHISSASKRIEHQLTYVTQ